MAGHLSIGIRQSSGKETWICTHARWLIYLIFDPEFQREGKYLDKFLEEAEKKTWGAAVISGPKKYDYGYVAVDFINKTVFSRQGYSSLDHALICNNDGDYCGKDLLSKLKKHNDIDIIYQEHPLNQFCKKTLNYSSAIKAMESNKYIYVTTKGPLYVDHSCTRPASDVKKWAKRNGWKLKTDK